MHRLLRRSTLVIALTGLLAFGVMACGAPPTGGGGDSRCSRR